jgi:hypothetical protein
MTSSNLSYMMQYILKHVDELTLEERTQIYRIIMDSRTDESKIVEKGAGIEIKFKNLRPDTIISIYNFVDMRIMKKKRELSEFPDSE